MLCKLIAILFLSLQFVLLVDEAANDSPCYGEVGRCAAGIEYWKHWRFSLYTECLPVPIGSHTEEAAATPSERLGPLPGWYCVSAKQIFQSQDTSFDYFRTLVPVDYVADTMQVYHITVDQANELRRKMGLPAVSDVSGSDLPQGSSNGERH
jgi:hypothetical protein